MLQIYPVCDAFAPFLWHFVLIVEPNLIFTGKLEVMKHSLTPVAEVIRYRLRRGDRVVGWMRQEANGSCYYSREGLWWTGRPIQWAHRDRCCGLRDVDDRWLHEGDLVLDLDASRWRRHRPWLVLCDENNGWIFTRRGRVENILFLEGAEIEKRRWRWAGVGWR